MAEYIPGAPSSEKNYEVFLPENTIMYFFA